MKKIKTIELNSNGSGKAVFSPNGEIFAHKDRVRRPNGSIVVIRSAVGEELNRISLISESLGPIAFSPDGSTLIVSDSESGILFWDTTTWTHVRTIDGDQRRIFDIAFSFDGKVITSGSFSDKTIRLWDVATGKTIAVLEMGFFALSPIDQEIAIAHQNSIRFYNCRTGEFIRENHLAFQPSRISFSSDGRLMAITSDSPTFYVAETSGGILRREIKRETYDDVVHAVFSPDGKTLAAVDSGSIVTLWDWQSGEQIGSDFTLSDKPFAPAFSPDGKLLICGGSGRWGYIDIWELSE